MSVSFQEVEPQSIGSFMDASRMTAQQHGLHPEEQELERDWSVLTTATRAAGLSGEVYLDIPYNIRNNQQLIDGSNRAAGKEVAAIWFPELWVPGRRVGGYTDEQLTGGSSLNGAVRMAVHGDNKNEPLLHFLGLPFDGKYAKVGERTQLEEIADWSENLKVSHPNLSAEALSARAVLLIAQNRINMQGKTALPIKWGYMRDGTLSRAEMVDGDSSVGSVGGLAGRLGLGRDGGGADGGIGVGLSVGLDELQSLEN